MQHWQEHITATTRHKTPTTTNMITHEAGQTYRVLARGGVVSPARLEEALNSMGGDPAYASRVTTD